MAKARALLYCVTRGLRQMSEAPLVQLLAVATTAVCMLLLGAVMLTWHNARGVADAWGVDVPITAYLVDGAATEDVDDLAMRLAATPEVERVELVGPSEAMRRLADGLGGDGQLVAGIEPDVLPASIEIHLRADAPGDVGPLLAERLAAFGVVDEVAVAGEWVEHVDVMLATLGDVAVGAAALVAFACIAIIWSTIRLAVYARRAEIQILRLVGGSARFVRGPFIVEGLLQGAMGAAVALALLWIGFDAVHPFLERGLSMMFAAGALRFFTPIEIAFGVGFGALVGVVGSRAALGRYVET
jgi:cell division transport system permease protein